MNIYTVLPYFKGQRSQFFEHLKQPAGGTFWSQELRYRVSSWPSLTVLVLQRTVFLFFSSFQPFYLKKAIGSTRAIYDFQSKISDILCSHAVKIVRYVMYVIIQHPFNFGMCFNVFGVRQGREKRRNDKTRSRCHGNHFVYFYHEANKGTQPENGKNFHLKNISRESLIVVLVNTAKKKLFEIRFLICTPALIR